MSGTLVVPNPGPDVYHSFGGAGSASYPLIRVEMAQEPYHAGSVDAYRSLIASHSGLYEHWRFREDPSVTSAPWGEVGGIYWGGTGTKTTTVSPGEGTISSTHPLVRDDADYGWYYREGQGTASSIGSAFVASADHWHRTTGGTWTIEGWFVLMERDHNQATSGSRYRTLVFQNNQFWIRTLHDTPGGSEPHAVQFEFYVRGGTNGDTWHGIQSTAWSLGTKNQLEIGKPYHFVCTWDEGGSPQAAFYLNGELMNSRSGLGTTEQTAGTDNIYVGANTNHLTAQDTGWVGILDEIAWYTEALSLAEAQEHYRAGIEQWVDVTEKVRALEWGAGRPHELQRSQPGYVRAVVDNSDGWFDTTYDGGTFDALGPLAQIRIRSRTSGTIGDRTVAGTVVDEFRGMVEALPQGWIGGGGHDAVVEFEGYDPLGYLSVADLQLSYEQLVLNDDPVAYWRLNDAQGENLARELVTGGTAYDGTVNNDMNGVGSNYITFGTAGVRASAGIDGGDTAAAFDPSGASTYGDRITIQDADWQDFAEGKDAISIEFWLWQDSVIDGSHIIGKGTAWAVRNSLGTIDFGLAYTPWQSIATTDSAVLGTATWQHVVVVHGGYAGQGAKIYLNGVEQSVSEVSGTVGGGAYPIEIGGVGTPGLPDPAVPITGILDEVALYAYPLTAEQVKVHYYTGLGQVKSETTDDRLDDLLDRALVPRRFRSLEVGQSTLDTGTLSGDTERALAQLQQATQTEDGLIFADRGGTIRFQDRHYRYTDNAGTVAILGDRHVVASRNLVYNGHGQDYLDGWGDSADGTVGIVSTPTAWGTAAFSFAFNADGGDFDQVFFVPATHSNYDVADWQAEVGDELVMSMKFKGEAYNNIYQLRVTCAGLHYNQAFTDDSTDWKDVSSTITIATTGGTITSAPVIYQSTPGAPSPGTVYVTAVQLERGGTVTEYVPYGDGRPLEFRYLATEGGEDLQNTWNQIEVNSITGGTQVQATDPDSIRQYGPRSFSRDLLISDVDEMQDAAGYLIGRYSTPGFRYGQIEFAMARLEDDYERGLVAGFDLSERYTVKRRRAGNASGTIERDVFLEGYVHTLLPGSSWKTTISTSPANSYEFWVLDESELDSTTRLAY